MQIVDIFPQMVAQLSKNMSSNTKQMSRKDGQGTKFQDVLSSVRTEAPQTKSGEAVRAKPADTTSKQEDQTGKTTDIAEELGDTGDIIEDDADEMEDLSAVAALLQTGVVLILEGNKEIDAAPEMTGDVTSEIGAIGESGAPVVEDGEIPVPQAEMPEAEVDDEVTEQMARMPDVTEKPREAKTENSDDGELCPLENENEVSGTKENKDNTPRVTQTAEDKPVEDDSAQERLIPTQQTVDVRPERLSAEEQLKGVTVQQPVSQDNLFEAMVDKIETMKTGGMNTMSIQLKPEYLGKVSLQLAMTEQGLQVRINADDLNVRHAIGGQINALIESLSSKGVAVAEVEVLYTGAGGYDFTNNQGGNAQPEQSAPSRRYAGGGADDMSGFEIQGVEETPVLDDELSSVEYRA